VPAPVIVTVLAPPVNVEPAPDVSQLPVTVHAPVVSVSVPDAPPVIATFDALTADAFAVRMPASPMVSAPPVRVRALVARGGAAGRDVAARIVHGNIPGHRDGRSV